MENYQMGRSCGRPYRTTCGMNRMPSSDRMTNFRQTNQNERRNETACTDCDNCMAENTSGHPQCGERPDCNCRMPGTACREQELYKHADRLVPAMAYVPCQRFTRSFDLDYALKVGTIFPELCKPFCGKRGVRK